MKLVLPKEFPASPPLGFFLTKIFHPNVASNGAICVNTLKRDWKPEHGIRHILLTIKCLLIYPNPESALNEEAGRLLLEHYEDYSSRARMMTGIHAKPSRVPDTAAGSSGGSDVTAGKKRPLESVPGSTASGLVEKKKKDKKKALKRL
jgi:ubiquitin-conjugating enzyme E2 S